MDFRLHPLPYQIPPVVIYFKIKAPWINSIFIVSEWPLKWDDSLDMFCLKKKYLIIKLIYIFMVCLQVKKTHTCFFKKMLVFVKMSGNNDII